MRVKKFSRKLIFFTLKMKDFASFTIALGDKCEIYKILLHMMTSLFIFSMQNIFGAKTFSESVLKNGKITWKLNFLERLKNSSNFTFIYRSTKTLFEFITIFLTSVFPKLRNVQLFIIIFVVEIFFFFAIVHFTADTTEKSEAT